ncbi:uncharacterized protein BDR25DRAFT_252102, partial [Lindgomyces ingoldianus]
MAVKRKNVSADNAGSKRKFRRAIDDEEDEAYGSDTASQQHDSKVGDLPVPKVNDEVAAFTENGNVRAWSEARREWNKVCPVEGCGRRFNRPCRLEQHMLTHSKERPFSCPYGDCDKTFTRKDHVDRHTKAAHSNAERSFVCDRSECGKTFTNKERLVRHQNTHEARLRCVGYPPCEQEFRKKDTLQRHIRAEHLGLKPFACDHVDDDTGKRCTAAFDLKPALKRHIENCHGDGELRFSCGICITSAGGEPVETEAMGVVILPKEPIAFRTQPELRDHFRNCHPPTCQHCGKKCTTEHGLRAHIDVAHETPEGGLYQYPCPKPGCNRSFNRRGNLKVHIKCVHDNLRNWICGSFDASTSNVPEVQAWDGKNSCDFATTCKSTLEQHIRTQHLNSQNRKNTRRAAKEAKKKNMESRKATRTKKQEFDESMLGLLTGVGYDEGRPVACFVSDCNRRFTMDRDLRRHLRGVDHKLSDEEIEERIAERDALQGGPFWIGGLDGDDMLSHPFDPTLSQYQSPYMTPSLSQSQTPYLDPDLSQSQ